jgi:hypothetical protein
MHLKVFSHMKNISLKDSGVGSCFEAFVEMSETVSLDFNLDTQY